jgi:DNA-binding transcriptional LysR family regulator
LHWVRASESRFGRYPVPPIGLRAAYHSSFFKVTSTIEIAKLNAVPLLVLDRGFFVRRTFDAVGRIAGVEPNIIFESRAASNLLALAEASHGVAVIPSVVATSRYKVRIAQITH